MQTLERIRSAVLNRRYAFSEHAYDEMDEDNHGVNLSGQVGRLDIKYIVLTDDPRGTRYVVVGTGCDLTTQVAVVARFVEGEQLLIITVYEVQ